MPASSTPHTPSRTFPIGHQIDQDLLPSPRVPHAALMQGRRQEASVSQRRRPSSRLPPLSTPLPSTPGAAVTASPTSLPPSRDARRRRYALYIPGPAFAREIQPTPSVVVSPVPVVDPLQSPSSTDSFPSQGPTTIRPSPSAAPFPGTAHSAGQSPLPDWASSSKGPVPDVRLHPASTPPAGDPLPRGSGTPSARPRHRTTPSLSQDGPGDFPRPGTRV